MQLLSWTTPYSGSVDVFYAVLRSTPRISGPDESREADRQRRHLLPRAKPAHAAQDCHLFMPRIASVEGTSYVDRPPPGRWTYRVALASNWRNDTDGGDLLLVSEPVTVG